MTTQDVDRIVALLKREWGSTLPVIDLTDPEFAARMSRHCRASMERVLGGPNEPPTSEQWGLIGTIVDELSAQAKADDDLAMGVLAMSVSWFEENHGPLTAAGTDLAMRALFTLQSAYCWVMCRPDGLGRAVISPSRSLGLSAACRAIRSLTSSTA